MNLQLRWSSNCHCHWNAILNFGTVSHLLLFPVPSCAHLSFCVRFCTIGVLVDSQDMTVVKRLEASTFVVCKSCCWSSDIHNVSNLFSCLQHAQVSHAKYSLQLIKLQKHLEMGKSSVSPGLQLFHAVTHSKLRTAFTFFLWLKFLLKRPR